MICFSVCVCVVVVVVVAAAQIYHSLVEYKPMGVCVVRNKVTHSLTHPMCCICVFMIVYLIE